jgi:hypothetical protein
MRIRGAENHIPALSLPSFWRLPAMLTAVEVRQAKPKTKAYKLTDSHGLFLHIMPNGTKAWRYRYRFAGKESVFTLGAYPEISLEDARSARGNARAMLKEGKNPTTERKQEIVESSNPTVNSDFRKEAANHEKAQPCKRKNQATIFDFLEGG